MSAIANEVAFSVRECDPKPDHCSMCFCGPREDLTFYDCTAAFDAGAVIDTSSQAYVSGSDDLVLCAQKNEKGDVVGGCVAVIGEATGFKPQLHARQFREIQRLELRIDHWRDAAGRKDKEIARLNEYVAQLESTRETPRRRA